MGGKRQQEAATTSANNISNDEYSAPSGSLNSSAKYWQPMHYSFTQNQSDEDDSLSQLEAWNFSQSSGYAHHSGNSNNNNSINQKVNELSMAISDQIQQNINNPTNDNPCLLLRIQQLESQLESSQAYNAALDKRLSALEKRQSSSSSTNARIERLESQLNCLAEQVLQQGNTLSLLVDEGDLSEKFVFKDQLDTIVADVSTSLMNEIEDLKDWLSQLDIDAALTNRFTPASNTVHDDDLEVITTQLNALKEESESQKRLIDKHTSVIDAQTRATSSKNTQLTASIHNVEERESITEHGLKAAMENLSEVSQKLKKLQDFVATQLRNQKEAKELLQENVATITSQVVKVTRQYVTVRIRDNNRLLDATLRKRIPAYAENDSENFMLVRKGNEISEHSPSYTCVENSNTTSAVTVVPAPPSEE